MNFRRCMTCARARAAMRNTERHARACKTVGTARRKKKEEKQIRNDRMRKNVVACFEFGRSLLTNARTPTILRRQSTHPCCPFFSSPSRRYHFFLPLLFFSEQPSRQVYGLIRVASARGTVHRGSSIHRGFARNTRNILQITGCPRLRGRERESYTRSSFRCPALIGACFWRRKVRWKEEKTVNAESQERAKERKEICGVGEELRLYIYTFINIHLYTYICTHTRTHTHVRARARILLLLK